MNRNDRKYTSAEDSVYVESNILEIDDIPDDLIDHAQEYIESRAESDDMHWHHENVNSWH